MLVDIGILLTLLSYLQLMLSITFGQFVKTKFRVNLKYHKLVIIFFLHTNTTVP